MSYSLNILAEAVLRHKGWPRARVDAFSTCDHCTVNLLEGSQAPEAEITLIGPAICHARAVPPPSGCLVDWMLWSVASGLQIHLHYLGCYNCQASFILKVLPFKGRVRVGVELNPFLLERFISPCDYTIEGHAVPVTAALVGEQISLRECVWSIGEPVVGCVLNPDCGLGPSVVVGKPEEVASLDPRVDHSHDLFWYSANDLLHLTEAASSP